MGKGKYNNRENKENNQRQRPALNQTFALEEREAKAGKGR